MGSTGAVHWSLVRENQQSSAHNFVKDFSSIFPKSSHSSPLKKGAATENPLAYGKTEVQPLFEPLPTAISSIVFGNHVPCEHYGSTAKFGIQTRNPAKRLRV